MANTFDAQLSPVGQVIKSIGYKGALLIDPLPGYQSFCENLQKCLIRVNGIWAPFFVQSIHEHGDHLEVQFEDIDENIARSLNLQLIYVMTHDISFSDLDDPDDDSELEEWIGYTIIDEQFGKIGVIEEIKILPGQELAIVASGGKKIAIPFVEELISDLNLETKTIRMVLPEGLLDL